MPGSSACTVYGGLLPALPTLSATPSKPPTVVTTNTESRPKIKAPRNNVQSYMATKNEGGDPVTALALRSDTPSQSYFMIYARDATSAAFD
ncbi:hypothetical protein PG985_009721 [Apiospora marii]|uniref:uncharacterized protein n=1 Tax=Apiospora marii TaxID=335849 RepID=UPI003131F518